MSHLHTTRNPMSGARRDHVHGPLQGMDYDDVHPLVTFSRRFAFFAMGFAGVVALYHVASALEVSTWWFS